MNIQSLPQLSKHMRVIRTRQHRALVTQVLTQLSDGDLALVQGNGQGAWHVDPNVRDLIDHVVYALAHDDHQYVRDRTLAELSRSKIRVVHNTVIRGGVHIGEQVVLMPYTFINIGAHIGRMTMIDTHASVGAGAYIGKRVHISAKVSIGGMLEPRQERPVIIEDNCFIGALSSIAEGARICQGAVLGVGSVINSGIKIFDVRGSTVEELPSRYIPPNAVAVPAMYKGKDGLYYRCMSVIKNVTDKTRRKTTINEQLR